VSVRADTKDRFVIIGPKGNNDHYFIPPSSLPPLVRGFLILLGPNVFVSAEDLQILTDSDCFYVQGVTLDVPAGVEILFERIRFTYDQKICEESGGVSWRLDMWC
jgi:hypothetical protein